MKTLRWIALAIALAVPQSAEAQPLRTWCMDAWLGELCFDVTTFRVVSDWHFLGGERFDIGGWWYGAGYPTGNVDHLGRGPGWALGRLGLASTGVRYIDPVTQEGSISWATTVLTTEGEVRLNSLDDFHYVTFAARRSTDPDEDVWDQAACRLGEWDVVAELQPCRVTMATEPGPTASVPEPGSLLLLLTGLLGLLPYGLNLMGFFATKGTSRPVTVATQ